MKRDMDLMRKILFAVEEQYLAGKGNLMGVQVEGYDKLTIAEHCELLYQSGLVKDYKPTFGGNEIQYYMIGNLTSRGYDYLELIRNEDTWDKTSKEIEEKKLPKTVEWIAKIAGVFTGNVVKELNS